MIDAEYKYITSFIPLGELARMEGVRYTTVRDYLRHKYGRRFFRERSRICYSISKRGDKNPRLGIKPANYKGLCEDGRGYLTVIKPEWYTSRKKYARVFAHHVVVCEALGLTEIPRGFCVHHIDGDTRNNHINNLALMTLGAHTRLHHQ